MWQVDTYLVVNMVTLVHLSFSPPLSLSLSLSLSLFLFPFPFLLSLSLSCSISLSPPLFLSPLLSLSLSLSISLWQGHKNTNVPLILEVLESIFIVWGKTYNGAIIGIFRYA
jgi:hypothetical protein